MAGKAKHNKDNNGVTHIGKNRIKPIDDRGTKYASPSKTTYDRGARVPGGNYDAKKIPELEQFLAKSWD